jgi:predicted DNA-binding protein
MTDTRILTLVIDSAIDRELESLANESGRDKQKIALEALRVWLEDREDVRHAMEMLARNEETIPSAEVRRELGLED